MNKKDADRVIELGTNCERNKDAGCGLLREEERAKKN